MTSVHSPAPSSFLIEQILLGGAPKSHHSSHVLPHISTTPASSSTGHQNALNSLINMTESQILDMSESFRSGIENLNEELVSFYTSRISCKKRRKSRTTFSNYQVRELERHFQKQKYLTPLDRDRLAAELSLSNNQVITWFQNRRAKLKREVEELQRDLKAAQENKQISASELSN